MGKEWRRADDEGLNERLCRGCLEKNEAISAVYEAFQNRNGLDLTLSLEIDHPP